MGRNVNNNQHYWNTCVKRKHMFPMCPRIGLVKSISICKGLWIEKTMSNYEEYLPEQQTMENVLCCFSVYKTTRAPRPSSSSSAWLGKSENALPCHVCDSVEHSSSPRPLCRTRTNATVLWESSCTTKWLLQLVEFGQGPRQGYQVLDAPSFLLLMCKKTTVKEQVATVLSANGLLKEGLGSKRSVSLSQFILNRKRPCFHWAGIINTNQNKQHIYKSAPMGMLGRRAHNQGCVYRARRKLSLAGTRHQALGKGEDYFSDGGKNRKNLLVLAILVFFFFSSCYVNTHWFPNMVVMCPTAEHCVGVDGERGSLVIQPWTFAEDTMDATKERATHFGQRFKLRF